MARTTPRRASRALAGAAALALAAAGAPAAAAAPSGPSAHAKRSVLTVAIAQSIDSWNPFLAVNLDSTSILRMMYDNLTAYAPKDYHAIGGLADRWSVSKNKLVWTFHIRSGAQWSDGKPITARDPAFTYTKMIKDPAADTANGSFTANFASATAKNDRTLVVKLKKPQATMLALDVPIVPEHIWKNVPDLGKFNNDKKFPVVGSGPFVLSGYKPDQYVRLTANKHYWRGAPKFDEIDFKFYKDTDAAVEGLRKGEVSFVTDLTPAQTTSLQGDRNIALNKASGKRFNGLAVNTGARTLSGQHFGDANPALRSKDVRQALDYAIDKRTLLDKAAGGIGELGTGYIPARFKDWHWSASPAETRGYDPKKAGQLLDKAGYKKGPGGLRRGPDGKPLTIRLMGHNDKPQDKQAATYIKEWLHDVGITAPTTFVDSAGYGDKLTTGNWDLAFDGWTVNPDPDFVLGIQRCADLPDKPGATSSTDMFYCNKQYDRLYDQQLAEYNPARRQATVKKMQKLFYDDAHLIQLYYPGIVEAYRTDQVADMQVQPDPGGNISHQDGMWGWYSATPVHSTALTDTQLGHRTVAGLGIVFVVCAGAWYLVARRRKATEGDRP